MRIDDDLEDTEDLDLSRSQIAEKAGIHEQDLLALRGEAGLRRDFKIPEHMVDGFQYGIDVSHWQGDINWQQVANAMPTFAYVKATQGATFVDRKFSTNISQAIEHGIAASAYHFLSANTGLQRQVDNFLGQYHNYHSDDRLPPCLDIEWDYNSSGVDRWASKPVSFISDKVNEWMSRVESALGVAPIFYTNKTWWESRLGANNMVLSRYDAWMSRYGGYGNDEPPVMNGYQWVLWQFTDRAQINGVAGGVDANLASSNFRNLEIDTTTSDEPVV